jgi:hypothetical protein
MTASMCSSWKERLCWVRPAKSVPQDSASSASGDYIQMYAGNATLLAESLEVIQRTASAILRAIRPEDAATAEQFAAAS